MKYVKIKGVLYRAVDTIEEDIGVKKLVDLL